MAVKGRWYISEKNPTLLPDSEKDNLPQVTKKILRDRKYRASPKGKARDYRRFKTLLNKRIELKKQRIKELERITNDQEVSN